jgi:hypothetical protein
MMTPNETRLPPGLNVTPVNNATTNTNTKNNNNNNNNIDDDDDNDNNNDNDENDDSLPQCIICCVGIRVFSVGSCNHRDVCAVCSVRLRMLYKDNSCPLCKADMPDVVYTRDATSPFDSFPLKSLPLHAPSRMFFDDRAFHSLMSVTWRFDCPFRDSTVAAQYAKFGARNADQPCTARAGDLKSLCAHVKKAHGMLYCDLCLSDRKVFLHEQLLYTPASLVQHIDETQRAPADEAANSAITATLRSSIESLGGTPQPPPLTGHPMCRFCDTRFYGPDQLFIHMRDGHETCHLCERSGLPRTYYQNYDALEVHFGEAHYLCKEPACRAKTFVVFSTDVALQTHTANVHARNNNKIEVAFNYRSASQTAAIGAANRSARGRSTDAEPLSSSAASSSSSSSSSSSAATPAVEIDDQPQPPTDEDEMYQRNRALINQIKGALNEVQFDQFRRESAALRRGEMSASLYYARFCQLFADSSSSATSSTGAAAAPPTLTARGARLFHELVALLPDAALRERLLLEHSSVKRKRQVEQEFPTLTPAAPAPQPVLQRGFGQWAGATRITPASAPEQFPTLGGGAARPPAARTTTKKQQPPSRGKWAKPSGVAKLKK